MVLIFFFKFPQIEKERNYSG